MARANDGGWDFIKVGGIYQYKEEGRVAMVKVLSDASTEKEYIFEILVLASDGGFVPGFKFICMHVKNPGGYWDGMSQFYESPEYVPLPIGKPWPNSLPGYEKIGIET